MTQSHIRVWRGDYYDGYLWYPADEDGILLKIDVETGQVDYAITMLMTEKGLKHAYHQIVATGDGILWAIPGTGNRILRIDLKSGDQELIDFPGADRRINLYSRFTGCIKFLDKIFCFPGNMNYIMEFDTGTKEMFCHKAVIEDSDKMLGMSMKNYFSWGTYRAGNMVYAIGLFCNYFLEMNLETKEYRLTALENEVGVYGFEGIAIHKDKLYMANRKGHVRVYDMESRAFLMQLVTEQKYRMLRECENGILLVPSGAGNYALYHEETGEIREAEYPEKNKFKDGPRGSVFARDFIEYENNYYIVTSDSNMLVTVNKRSGEIQFVQMYIGDRKKIMEHLSEEGNEIFREDIQLFCMKCMDLKSFINSITKKCDEKG